MPLKRILTMQDISCFGKCSLTVALPVISAAGVECAVLPTAVLSTHTGGLGDVHFRDLAGDIPPAVRHFQKIGLTFDGIYIGYLGSEEQIKNAKEVINAFRTPDNFVLLDPVMGDQGRLYARFDESYAAEMATLAALADYCVPNLTEAALLAPAEYPGEAADQKALEMLLSALRERYAAQFILTGVSADETSVGAALPGGRMYLTRRQPGQFHGTGDLFAAVLAAALARGIPLAGAIETAVDFTAAVIARTAENGTDERYGVDFESSLPMLSERMAELKRE